MIIMHKASRYKKSYNSSFVDWMSHPKTYIAAKICINIDLKESKLSINSNFAIRFGLSKITRVINTLQLKFLVNYRLRKKNKD